ncbi:hypothetical protein D3C87_1908170 [compost metagenome]
MIGALHQGNVRPVAAAQIENQHLLDRLLVEQGLQFGVTGPGVMDRIRDGQGEILRDI